MADDEENGERREEGGAGPLFQGLVRGMLPLYVLMLLERRPCHGIDMIRSFAEMSRGAWRPSPGSIYPVLRRLESEGLVAGRWQRGQAAAKRVYRLTGAGRRALPARQVELLAELERARRIIDQHVAALEAAIAGASPHGPG
jgi:DNA-binding PadR family transcriptional regulator